ncbi:hypothetical protein [Pseudoalteromonas aurantia]|uniref:Uncharacterized protein n=1 Tax=Pseudoalteromonas aurantia 208 TaxID=1314867 RepID=A0ABR9EHX6_9GAMM|nr:hypothetical protein [Pseudoalteromonas aurantia]MBE0370618.1 hypothetical protein [Pseudoalteromonas aurantia 208]
MSYKIAWVVMLSASSLLSANETNEHKVTALKKQDTGAVSKGAISVEFLLYLSDLTLVNGDIVGPLDMTKVQEADTLENTEKRVEVENKQPLKVKEEVK